MKKGLMFMGGLIGAALVCSVAMLYARDEEVRSSVDNAVDSVRDVYGRVKAVVAQGRERTQQMWEQQSIENQQWVDQQWEALGI